MYTKFYGFSEKPFEATPNPRFLFLTPSHREALDTMMDGISNRRRFISVTGEVGTGKTTLIYSLLNSLNEKVKTVFIFHPTITFKELLKTILLELDVKVAEKGEPGLLYQLVKYITQMDTDETIAIIIDEAQDLPEKVIRDLPMFFDLKSGAIQIVLVGQPEFENRIHAVGLRQVEQQMKIRCHIRSLTEEESKNYIDHRLKLVGSSSSQTFTPKALSMICSHAQGIPRLINILCDNAFLLGYSLSRKKIDVDMIQEVIKNMESPFLKKNIFPTMITAVKKFHLLPLRSNFPLRKTSLIILLFICLGGFAIFIHQYFQLRPGKTWDIKSITNSHVETQPSSTSPLQKMNERGLKDESSHPNDISSGSPPSITPPSPSTSSPHERDKLGEVVIVEEGQTLSYLAKKYYRTANTTLVALILDANTEIINADLIMINQGVHIPKITKDFLVIQSMNRTYKIHVGTFQNPDSVRLYRSEPVLKGRTIEVLPRKVSPKNTWYQVVVGPFSHKDECLKVIDQLKEKGLLPAL